MKVALIHYWLISMRGGEKVLEALCELYPEADIYTHVVDPDILSPKLKKHRIITTFISKLPFAKRFYQKYLPFMPLALEQLDLRDYDLVISSESGPAKGVLTNPDALHLCYCHSPMRYLWDMYPEYRDSAGFLTRMMMVPMAHSLRKWDYATGARVDHFVANSSFIAKRIQKTYRRDSSVIPPPVSTARFHVGEGPGEFYLWVGQLTAYKRPDLAIEAFNSSGKPLVVIGDGEMLEPLKAIAKDNITFLGRASDAQIEDHYARCKALVFPGVEDFGIVPIEAMASGRPVIAYGRGGALDTVIDGKTGVLFDDQSVAGLQKAIEQFEAEAEKFDKAALRAHAESFDVEGFKARIKAEIDAQLG